jgi:hypothetical protein
LGFRVSCELMVIELKARRRRGQSFSEDLGVFFRTDFFELRHLIGSSVCVF